MSFYSTLLQETAHRAILMREGKHKAMAELRFLEKSQYWPQQQLLDYQWQRLIALLTHAYETTTYYRRVMDECGMPPTAFKSFEDLERLPILTRDAINDNREKIISSRFRKDELVEFGSGGTTQRRLLLYRDKPGSTIKMAMQWRFEGFMGQRMADKMSVFWPPHVDFGHAHAKRTDFKDRYLLRNQLFYTGGATADTLRHFYDEFMAFKPSYLKCFPSGLVAFTEFALDNKLPLPRVKGIMSTGEMLLPDMRTLFEESYQAPVIDMYGSREVGNTSCECLKHEGHHIAQEIAVVEFIKDGRPVGTDEDGEIIVTDLTNYGFPMIRYQLGDMGRPKDGTCSCGRTLRLMSAGIGRLSDRYVALDGSRHSGLVIAVQVTETGPPMGKMQIIQKTVTDWQVKVVDNPPVTSEMREHITHSIKQFVGEAISVTIEEVGEIPPEKSGKLRFFKCEIEG